MESSLVWLTLTGFEKQEVLEELGFSVDGKGYLMLNGEFVKSPEGTDKVRVDDVKAVIPGSLLVITDVSEVEELSDEN